MIAFGPVPSRRLGRSLGINNIPPKVCSYSCVYCQLGHTRNMQVERQAFYPPEEILAGVKSKVRLAKQAGESVDYLAFVPDGEPTLDIDLGREIELLRPLGIKIAVISNASLIWREDVRKDLAKADWVSLKVDATEQEVWRRINRPQGTLKLTAILGAMVEFARTYSGTLVTETMLVQGINESSDHLRQVADFLPVLGPSKAYLSIPTRPPAERWVKAADEDTMNRAFQILSGALDDVEYLIGYEGNAFAFTGNIEEDLLSITAVHPMREEAVRQLLRRAGAAWSEVRELVERGELLETQYEGKRFYVRKLHS